MTLGLCIQTVFDSISYVSTSYTQEQVGDGVAGDDKNLTVFFDDNYDDILSGSTNDDYKTEKFVLEESGVDLESLSMSMSLSMSISEWEVALLDVSSEEANAGEVSLRT